MSDDETKTDNQTHGLGDILADAVVNAAKPNTEIVDNLINKEKETTDDGDSGTNSAQPGNPTTYTTGFQPNHSSIPAYDSRADEKYGTDSSGTKFDSRIHYLDENGKPKTTPTGKFRIKRGTGGNVNASVPNSPNGNTGQNSGESAGNHNTQSVPGNNPAACEASAKVIVNSLEMVAAGFIGDDWKMDTSERQGMIEAYRDYFIATGSINMPPYIPPIICTGMYIVSRMRSPQTIAKLEDLGIIKKKPKVKPVENQQ